MGAQSPCCAAAGAATLNTSGAFRPGGLSWVVAERALAFLVALGSTGQSGVQWVAATMPALRAAMLASLNHSKPLRYLHLQCQQCDTLAAEVNVAQNILLQDRLVYSMWHEPDWTA